MGNKAPGGHVVVRALLVTGSRDWTNEALLRRRIQLFVELLDIQVLRHGHCPIGADAMADTWGRELGLTVERYPADWNNAGPAAGPARNQQMVDLGAELCLAFPVPGSRGTWDCVRRAQQAGIDTLIYPGRRPFVAPRSATQRTPR